MKQTEGTETANVSFDLGAATMNYGNNAPYFQWGRKDPMPPSTGLANTRKGTYGTYSTFAIMSTTDISKTIRTPHYFNDNVGNPSLELWDVGNTSTMVNVNPIIKSIYDPSPVGFHLPCSGASQGWEEAGRSYWQNTTGKWGRYFYQLGPTTGNAVFFPALGYYKSGALIYTSEQGLYYSAGTISTVSGVFFFFFSTGVDPYHVDYRSFGFACRPVSE